MADNPIYEIIKQICKEKGIVEKSVVETIELALAAAYRKDFGNKLQNIKVEFNPETNQIKVFDIKTVVEDLPEEEIGNGDKEEKKEKEKDKKVSSEEIKEEGENEEVEKKRFNPKTDIQLKDALKIKKTFKIGDEIKTRLEIPGAFGRMAAQTAKQVIIQKLKEAERETLYQEFKAKEGEVMVGTVQRREGRLVLIDLGKITALLLSEEQIERESYHPGDHFKVYIISVNATTKGPEVFVSRTHPEIVRKLFELEIPEIANGTVKIEAVAREAGYRSKVAVWTDQENIDPIGSCIGQRGARVQTIISELKGEKIDIIEYNDNLVKFITNALAPAKILNVEIKEKEKTALVTVAEDQLSLAIGRAGQNVRLAVKLTGWKIDIISEKKEKVLVDKTEEIKAEEAKKSEKKKEMETERKKGTKAKKEKTEEKKEEETKKRLRAEKKPANEKKGAKGKKKAESKEKKTEEVKIEVEDKEKDKKKETSKSK